MHGKAPNQEGGGKQAAFLSHTESTTDPKSSLSSARSIWQLTEMKHKGEYCTCITMTIYSLQVTLQDAACCCLQGLSRYLTEGHRKTCSILKNVRNTSSVFNTMFKSPVGRIYYFQARQKNNFFVALTSLKI